MGALILSSIAFSVGGAFMKPSHSLSRLAPSLAVIACYLLGTVLLAHAVSHRNLATTYVLGLGVEAVVSIGVGLAVLGETVTNRQAMGLGLILLGIVAVRSP